MKALIGIRVGRFLVLGEDLVARRFFNEDRILRPMGRVPLVRERGIGTVIEDMTAAKEAGAVGFEFINEETGERFYWNMAAALGTCFYFDSTQYGRQVVLPLARAERRPKDPSSWQEFEDQQNDSPKPKRTRARIVAKVGHVDVWSDGWAKRDYANLSTHVRDGCLHISSLDLVDAKLRGADKGLRIRDLIAKTTREFKWSEVNAFATSSPTVCDSCYARGTKDIVIPL